MFEQPRHSFAEPGRHAADMRASYRLSQSRRQLSVHGTESALAKLDAELHESFVVLEETARQNAAGVGAKDLQRLQLQNASLKGSSMHMHVREEFLDALAFDGPDGRFPRGDEAHYRAALQEDAQRHAEASRAHKAANAKITAEVQQLIKETASAFREYQQTRAEVGRHLAATERSTDALARPLSPLPPLPDGPDEVQCQRELAKADEEAAQMEAECAALMAANRHDAAELAAKQQELAAMEAEGARLSSSKTAQVEHEARFRTASERAAEELAFMAHGISVQEVERTSMRVQLTTHQGDLLHRHELAMQLDGESADLLGATLEGDTIPIDIGDLVADTRDRCQSLSYLVRETKARLSQAVKPMALCQPTAAC